MSKSQRTSRRYRVHLSVRYERARDFVVEYAENLSSGGLFVRGHTDLQPLERVPVQLELPGYGTFQLTAEVAHVLTPEVAQTCKRKPGVGLQIVDAPAGFREALAEYLIRLGRRRDHMVLVADTECRRLVAEAGYQAGPVPGAEELIAAVAHSDAPVIGVVVSRAQEAQYRAEAKIGGSPELIHAIDYLEEMDALLTVLDAAIVG